VQKPYQTWREAKLSERAHRALLRQLAYQTEKSRRLQGQERDTVAGMMIASRHVRALLEEVHPIAAEAAVLEVGSGAHGLIFYFGGKGVGVDPLAVSYASLFPLWQSDVPTVAGLGEQLPFGDGVFDVVLCDNVVDHAQFPGRIVEELVRVLAPGGLLYFTVNIHHPIYGLASRCHSVWNALGIRYEIRPFADHTVHLTLRAARELFKGLPLRFVTETDDIAETSTFAPDSPKSGWLLRLKRKFFKNASYRLIALREA
jgi:SAM-dependent methyltransferase